ncbi:hypothetical protein C5167_036060 [Papaver somniferum]|nr:hypothetical protein C5167_036060 [Papaver somniferum]
MMRALLNPSEIEMFEWTQRPCSPELFSTPEKTKAGYKELNTIEDDECVVASPTQGAPTGQAVASETVKAVNCEQGNENIDEELAPCAKISSDEVLGDICMDLGEVAEVSNQSVKCATNSTATNVRNKICSKNKKARFNSSGADTVTDDLHEAIEANSENHATKETATKWGTSLDDQHTKSIQKNSEKIRKLDIQLKQTNTRSLKGNTVAAAAVVVVEEVQKNENQENGKASTKSPAQTDLQVDPPRTLNFADDSVKGVSVAEVVVESSKVVDPPKTSELEKRATYKHRDTKIVGDKSCMQELRVGKRVKFSTDTSVKTGSVGKVLDESNKAVAKENQASNNCRICAFCQSSTESEDSGKMLHYVNGKPVADYNKGAPNIYFGKDTAVNLGTEVARSKRIKCSCCGIKGASLGCYENSCRKSFHVPCAKMVPQCRRDTVSGLSKTEVREAEVVVQHGLNISQAWNSLGSSKKWVLCCSGLTDAEKEIVSEFARIAGVLVSKTFGTNVTHIIASTDTSGACKRTLKFLLGILDGKWILNIDCKDAMNTNHLLSGLKLSYKPWILLLRSNMKSKLISMESEDKPRLGRLRVQKKQPKLFTGLNFYFFGEFVPSYKGDLQNLVIAAGGTVLHRKPIKGDLGLSSSDSSTATFIIYSLDVPDECDPRRKSTICNRRKDEARALAGSSGTKFAGHPWLLDSIAACKLQRLT